MLRYIIKKKKTQPTLAGKESDTGKTVAPLLIAYRIPLKMSIGRAQFLPKPKKKALSNITKEIVCFALFFKKERVYKSTPFLEFLSLFAPTIAHDRQLLRRICVFWDKKLDFSHWWRRRESNPCPKIHSRSFLRVQVICQFPETDPNKQKSKSVSFLCMTVRKETGGSCSPLCDARAEAVVLLGRTRCT